MGRPRRLGDAFLHLNSTLRKVLRNEGCTGGDPVTMQELGKLFSEDSCCYRCFHRTVAVLTFQHSSLLLGNYWLRSGPSQLTGICINRWDVSPGDAPFERCPEGHGSTKERKTQLHR